LTPELNASCSGCLPEFFLGFLTISLNICIFVSVTRYVKKHNLFAPRYVTASLRAYLDIRNILNSTNSGGKIMNFT
jgi:hypothetical protein